MSDIDLKAERDSILSWGKSNGTHNPVPIMPKRLFALIDRLESAERRAEEAEKERQGAVETLAAVVHAAGGEVRVGPLTSMIVRRLQLVRYDTPETYETVFKATEVAQEGGK